MRHLWMAVAGVVVACTSVWPLAIDGQDVGLSKMIPAAGQTVVWSVPLVNDTDEEFSGEVTMTMRVARRGHPPGAPVTLTRQLTLSGAEEEKALGERIDFDFEWTPERNGWYRVIFEVPEVALVEREVAVTERDMWFVWFGRPENFRWCNVPTTVKTEEETEWWLRRGGIPARWKGGICYGEWPVERFVESWGDSRWIAIDEVSGPGEVTDKFIAAWEQLAAEQPDQWRAVWFIGAHDYWRDIGHLIDLFLPEIYLNYRSNHLGQFDRYLATARATGVIEKTIPALGIHQIKTDRGLVRTSPTRDDVLRQFRYLKRTVPELNGIGFFTSYSAAPGVAEYADDLCGAYYVNPVITITDPAKPLSMIRDAEGARMAATIRNVGGMDAENVRVEWVIGSSADGARLVEQTVARIAVGESMAVSVDLPDAPGWAPVELRIAPDEDYTVLDGRARSEVVWRETAAAESIAVPIEATDCDDRLLRLVTLPDREPRHLVELARDGGQDLVDTPYTLLPARPGMDEMQAAFSRFGSDREAMLLLRAGPSRLTSGSPGYSREGDRLLVSTVGGHVELDLAADAIVSIVPDGGEEVLRGPWRLNAPGHEGIGEARIEELPGALAVTIPWDSEIASGESQYIFFAVNPAIRVAREWRPKGEVTVDGAGDRCELFQRGGTFALQRGVGAPVQRGRLHDSDRYRDLLFGYLGGLGVAIDYRWRDTAMRSYDVTRLDDALDVLEVLYVWGTEATFDRPQTSCVWLVPHGGADLLDDSRMSATEALWRHLNQDQLAVVEGLPAH